MKKVLAVFLLLIFLYYSNDILSLYENPNNVVLTGYIDTEINLASVKYIESLIAYAERHEARLIIIKLNTPGGELEAIKKIVTLFETSSVPICSFVYPRGAVAWSGGVFLLFSSHIAVMASGTTIGSVQPVEITPTGINFINETKIVNAIVALLRHNARLHERNESIAERFVRENINIGALEAKKYHVIDIIADDIKSLLQKLENKKLVLYTVKGEEIWKLVDKDIKSSEYRKEIYFSNIRKAVLVEYSEGPQIIVLKVITNPLIAILMLIFGLYIFLIGLKTPGFGAEIVGGVMTLLSLAGLGLIGVEWIGVVLILTGFLLTLLELKTHIGFLVLAGASLIIFGSLMLIPSNNFLISSSILQAMRLYILASGIFIAGIFSIIVYKVAKVQMKKPHIGPEKLIGAEGLAVTDIDPIGEVRVLGEHWRARSIERKILKGERIKVVSREGLTLLVEKIKEV